MDIDQYALDNTPSGEDWEAAAATFDEQPDHGLRDPGVRAAWSRLLQDALPFERGRILDLGCGTGSLSLLLAGLGHRVTGIDLSPAMLRRAAAKAAAQGASVDFRLMEAARPGFPARHFDALVCRHVLWALPEPENVLLRWARLLKPGGRLFLVEGYWQTGAGLHADQLVAMLPPTLTLLSWQDLSLEPAYWGEPVEDERYALCASLFLDGVDQLPN